MSKISNIISDIKAWVKAGTTNEIFIRSFLYNSNIGNSKKEG